ncbi:Hydrolase, alpha [Candidatus Terasakiella magnetica]|uniref:Hydrolase, alpha n=1 Tax=Candidatus Terasakiella magnetica TaxID=1867952 RepID=A0A1C3RBX5_9PROT|nr:alpha/beta fold hydrolase [Candidatus Terasakiella magnetica]SCA54786.1 Hydrolase, alpha [Candidatus Terasakiella magnetica]
MPKKTKETLYLLPGLLCDRSLWRHQIEYLGQDYDVRVADFSKGKSIGDYAVQVLEDAPETFSIAGLSMGGYVAFELLRMAPRRINRVALLDTSPFADLFEHKEFRLSLIELAKDHGLEEVMTTILGRLIHPQRYNDEELVKSIDAMAHRIGVDGFIRQQTALLNRADSFDALKDIEAPVLIIVGRQDGMTPVKVSRQMGDEIKNSSLVEIENCGHLSTMEQPEAVTALLRYWLQN